MRVVLDSTILISAFTFPGGSPEYVYRSVLRDRVSLVTSPVMLAEFGRILSERFEWENARSEAAITQIVRICTLVRPEERLSVIEADPDSDRVLEAAFAGRAHIIVSGDRRLLGLRRWHGIHIMDAPTLLQDLSA